MTSYLFKVSTITKRGEGLEVMKRNVTAKNVGGEAILKRFFINFFIRLVFCIFLA